MTSSFSIGFALSSLKPPDLPGSVAQSILSAVDGSKEGCTTLGGSSVSGFSAEGKDGDLPS
jgi:hypothetical protein